LVREIRMRVQFSAMGRGRKKNKSVVSKLGLEI